MGEEGTGMESKGMGKGKGEGRGWGMREGDGR